MLTCKSRKLSHAVKILKSVAEGLTSLVIHQLFNCNLFTSLIANCFNIISCKIIFSIICLHQRVYFIVCNRVHRLHKCSDGPCVNLPSEFCLNLNFIAFSNSNLSHIVAEAHNFKSLTDGYTDSGAHPTADSFLNRIVLPAAGYNFSRHSESCCDKSVFTVSVSCLIKIHEIHVDFIIGYFTVILSCKMAIRLLKRFETVNPHF